MINIVSRHIIYVFFFAAIMYMSYVATDLQDLAVMLVLAFGIPALALALPKLISVFYSIIDGFKKS